MGGEVLQVCRVMGYEMPSFIFWASLAIFLLFLLASAALLLQCSALESGLERAAGKLERLGKGKKAKEDSLDEKQLEEIRDVMKDENAVASLWSRFEETLLISPDGDEIFSTRPTDAFFSRAALIEENVSSALFSAIPGVLTGVGLLVTFVAILDGLSHVKVSANMDVEGVSGLINGLSGKFVSSIVAVSCAVLFVFVERVAYSRPARAQRQLVASLTERFRRRTTEHLLYQLLLGKGRGR
jgi:hypothetical protein